MKTNEMTERLIAAREEYIKVVRAELLGPGSELALPDAEHELISSSPLSRYSVGILYPPESLVNLDNDEMDSIVDEPDDSESDDFFDTPQEKNNTAISRQSLRKRVADETAHENLDEEVTMATQYLPSSMGITFAVSGNMDVVCGSLSFAMYRKAEIADCIIPFSSVDSEHYPIPNELAHIFSFDRECGVIRLIANTSVKEIRSILKKDTAPNDSLPDIVGRLYRLVDISQKGYVRVPHSASFTLNFSQSDYLDDLQKIDGTSAKITALRTKLSEKTYALTVMLVNATNGEATKPTNCIFQARMEISTQQNEFLFIENKSEIATDEMDDEERSLQLIYRKKKIYGTGLGTAIDWAIDVDGRGRIWSDFFPQLEVPAVDFGLPKSAAVSAKSLSMKYLSDLDTTEKAEKISALRSVVDLYKGWVDELCDTAAQLEPEYQSAAAKNTEECRRACSRMYAGIKTLEYDEKVYSAFVLANRAMFMQRVHLRMQARTADTERYPGDQQIKDLLKNMDYYQEEDDNCQWRPFQIAFLLMDINSVVFDNSSERELVDLIWFPTGGGKTEAYLGLTAFTIFYRKLAHLDESGGTSVIMRYTLRLLAAQQFTRAATLICACEYIRRDCQAEKKYPVYFLGEQPITIGLWIGGEHTPNSNGGDKGADSHLQRLQNATASSVNIEKEKHNKFQVLKCPWCGTKLVRDSNGSRLVGKWGYSMRDKHFYLFCPHQNCDFTDRLPIQVVDEELYKAPPTLLFGTVDKFAMMPWDARVGSFFAVENNNRSPELIIQDELHLISGALGTMVGLYETAVDALCGQKGVFPKIIASTATIRRAKEQCSVLYNREVVQFPAPGLDADDSFFARTAEVCHEEGMFGRKYVGIMPSGKTKAMMEIRATAALLQRIYMEDLSYADKDKLWTLTVYFNSLKDLGKAATLMADDVKDFIRRTARRLFCEWRSGLKVDELTSRVTTTELNETLDNLEKLEYSQENIAGKRYATDVLLATNMISVGIDIARLNAMLMVGQPKLTSEYIQASSRVGRSFPGTVFIQYDATKSRDRSHYEQFKAYHGSFYRFVEPTGATPFSKPARERALHAVIIAIMRQRVGELRNDSDAGNFDKVDFGDIIDEVSAFVVDRAESINRRLGNGLEDNSEDIRHQITEFFDRWQSIADECRRSEDQRFYFGRNSMMGYHDGEGRRLLKRYNSSGRDDAFETLTSMRNVDTQVRGSIIIWEENNHG